MQINSGFTYFFRVSVWLPLTIKLILAAFFGWQLAALGGEGLKHGVFKEFDDTRSYYEPVEMFMKGKGYSRSPYPEMGETEITPFAGRLPGILPIYGPLYFLLGEGKARSAMIFIQVILNFLSILMLASLAEKLFHSRKAMLFTLVMYSLAYQVHIYDHYGLMESLSISAMIASLFGYVKYQESERNKWLILAGIAFAWSIFLRPVMGVFGVIWVGVMINRFFFAFGKTQKGVNSPLRASKPEGVGGEKSSNSPPNPPQGGRSRIAQSPKNPDEVIQEALLFFLPLLLTLTAWNIRNYTTFDRVIFLEDTWINSYPHEPEYRPHGLAIRSLIKTMGGDMLYWNPGTMGNALMGESPTGSIGKTLPARAFSQEYPLDSLERLSALYHLANRQWLPDKENSSASVAAVSLANRIKASFKQHHPIAAYIGSRVRLMYAFLFQNIRLDLPFPSKEKITTFQFLVKGGFILMYYLITIFGMIASLWVLWRGNGMARWVALFPWVMIFFLTWGVGMIEDRYLVPLIPFWVVMVAGVVGTLQRKSKGRPRAGSM